MLTGSSPKCKPSRGCGSGNNCAHDNSAVGCSPNWFCKWRYKYRQLQVCSGTIQL